MRLRSVNKALAWGKQSTTAGPSSNGWRVAEIGSTKFSDFGDDGSGMGRRLGDTPAPVGHRQLEQRGHIVPPRRLQ